MSALWKEIFHDADDYISLIFGSDFRPEFSAWKYNSIGVLTSMIIGERYRFCNGKRYLNGLYLCGVSTRSEYRNKGEFNELLNHIEYSAKINDIQFLFLIPANDKLRRYYTKFGFKNIAKSIHDIRNIFSELIYRKSSIDVLYKHYCNNCKLNFHDKSYKTDTKVSLYLSDVIKKIKINRNEVDIPVEYIHDLQKSESCLPIIIGDNNLNAIIHSEADWLRILREWILSSGIIIIKERSLLTVICKFHVTKLITDQPFKTESAIYLLSKDSDIIFSSEIYRYKDHLTKWWHKNDLIFGNSCSDYGMVKILNDEIKDKERFLIEFMLD